jgi:hypothetical protein
MESLKRQAEALAITHAKLREDNANQRKVIAEYEHYCVLLENTLALFAAVPVERMRYNYRTGRPMLNMQPIQPQAASQAAVGHTPLR